MILMVILMVIVLMFIIGYIVEMEGCLVVLFEKEKKFFVVVNLFNQVLGDCYDFYIDLLCEECICVLNVEFVFIIENIIYVFFGIGVGYYNKMLDVIIIYVFLVLYQNNVGVIIVVDYFGCEVMCINIFLVYLGRQVCGDILNLMFFIECNGEIFGYIWVNELIEDICCQVWKMDVRIIIVFIVGLLISLLLIVFFFCCLSVNIDIIIDGFLILV